MEVLKLLTIFCAFTQGFAAPTATNKENGFVDSLTHQMQIQTFAVQGFATTSILNIISNKGNDPETVKFAVVLPKGGILQSFIMDYNGKNFTASVKEINEAQAGYDEAISVKLSAGHVFVNPNDPNRYEVSLNVKPQSEVKFYLVYREIIKRSKNWYELSCNIYAEKFMKNYTVDIFLHEDKKITDVIAEAVDVVDLDESKASIESDAKTTAQINNRYSQIHFAPVIEKQKQLFRLETKGFSKQFVIQYKIEQTKEGQNFVRNEFKFDDSIENVSILPPNKSLLVVEPKPIPVTTPRVLTCATGYMMTPGGRVCLPMFIRFG